MGSNGPKDLPLVLPPQLVAARVKVLTAMAIAHSQLQEYNKRAVEAGCPEASFEDAVLWFVEASLAARSS
jgi:hypothetical protein